jgi:hypothetical protein
MSRQVLGAISPRALGRETMAEHENKKSLKDRAQEVIQGVVDALESLFPAPQQLIPIPVTARPRPRRR